MKLTRLALATVAALVAGGSSAEAQSDLRWYSTSATFSDWVFANTSGTSGQWTVDNTGSQVSIGWGDNNVNSQSYLQFNRTNPPDGCTGTGGSCSGSDNFVTLSTSDGFDMFRVGSLKFYNDDNPANNRRLTAVDLNISVVLDVNSASISPNEVSVGGRFDFGINEPVNPTADNLLVTMIGGPTSFVFNSVTYYFQLMGISGDNGASFLNSLTVEENDSKTVGVYAKVYTQTAQVAEPASFALVASGLAGLAAVARRRRNNAV